MSDFDTIYKILRAIRASMDYEDFDKGLLAPEKYGISRPLFFHIVEALIAEGYISGIGIHATVDGDKTLIVNDPSLTIKGMEYLEENTTMKKIAKNLKGIKDIVPGL